MDSSSDSGKNDAESALSSYAGKAIDFARLIGKLKTTPRTGWVRRGVPRYESVADHSWRVAALSLLLANVATSDEDASLDIGKCMQMALVHDLAECLVGDIAPDDNVSSDEKQRRETDAMGYLAESLRQATNSNPILKQRKKEGNEPTGSFSHSEQFLMNLVHEYEERKTKEAKAVKDLDLLDMILQADEYEERFDMDLSDFFLSTPASRFQNPALRIIAEEVHKQREDRIKKRGTTAGDGASANLVKSSTLSMSEKAFIEEYAMASPLNAESIERVVIAFKTWNNNST